MANGVRWDPGRPPSKSYNPLVRPSLIFPILILAVEVWSKSLTWTPDSACRVQTELWLDPYYTAGSVTRSLVSEPIAKLDADGERATDWWLLNHLAHPRDILLEASVNPLPVAGWASRRFSPDLYWNAEIQGINLIRAATQGFPEPWALSLFFGNVVNLVSSQDTAKVNGVGYSGFLVSWSHWNLVDNKLVVGDWIETEVKIKGDDFRPERKMGWSFRAGWREHFNPDIRGYVYGSIVRRRTDFAYTGWNPLRNSSLELRMDLDRQELPGLVPLRWSAVVGKKFPFDHGRFAAALSLGVVDEVHPAYSAALLPLAPRGFKFLFQPNLEW